MTLRELKLNELNHFVAMEYHMLILNRTYLILLTSDSLIGIKVNGIVSIESGGDRITRKITNSLSIQGDLSDPHSYIKAKFIQQIIDTNLTDGSIIKANKSNFIIKKESVIKVYHDEKSKWGMGYYPHDGKVYITTKEGKKREFIILGNQSGKKIVQLISKVFDLKQMAEL